VTLRIATRGSDLALWQARTVAAALQAVTGDAPEVNPIRTRGDRETGVPLAEIGGQGLFTAEVDRALAGGLADLAVHSLKDLPVEPLPGFRVAALLERGPVEDVLISKGNVPLSELPQGAVVGTSSPRRAAYVRVARPDVELVDIRGNVPTRVARVHQGDLDATLLARAGVVRLGLDVTAGEVLSPPEWLPAPGQGAVAVVIRSDDASTAEWVDALDHADTRTAVEAERAVLAGIGGGCSLPLGTFARIVEDGWEVRATLFSPDGKHRLDDVRRGPEPRALAAAIADGFLARGADRWVGAGT
jgi:hydroxymethylbilane synthase